MTVPDWVGTVAPAFTALAAWAALAFSIYNAYARRRDRKPRVEVVARWNLPSDSPQVMKGPGSPATADPGGTIFECEITNVGMVGVKISEVYMWIHAPPGKPIPLRLPQGEEPKKLDNGDSQLWLSTPFDYECLIANGVYWTLVLVLDSAGNSYYVRNSSPAEEIERDSAMRMLSTPVTASVVGNKGVRALGAERPWWRRLSLCPGPMLPGPPRPGEAAAKYYMEPSGVFAPVAYPYRTGAEGQPASITHSHVQQRLEGRQ